MIATIGKRNSLSVLRDSVHGLYLDGGHLGEILLPGRYIPRNVGRGDKIDVFLYLDSEDRLVATTETPKANVGEVACFKVLSVHPRAGAFLDWGLSKDLLLPFREQVEPVRPGQNVVAFVYLDPKTNRIAASTRLQRFLNRETPSYSDGQRVQVMVASRTPLGYNVVVEKEHVGLLFAESGMKPLEVGQEVAAFVRTVRPNGKIDLGLDASGYKRVASLQTQIVQALERSGGKLNFDDSSSPELIRDTFGVSKKAFKQALGALYKSRRIQFTNPGIELLDNTSWDPAASRTHKASAGPQIRRK